MLLLIAPLLVVLATGAGGQDPRDETREEVRQVIAHWRQKEERSNQALADALAALGWEATPYLCELLDTDRGGAPAEPLAEAIGGVGHSKAPGALGRLLDSDVVSERIAAVEALGALEMRDACPHLVRAIDDSDASVAKRAEAILIEENQLDGWVAREVNARLRVDSDKGKLGRLLAKKGGEETHLVLVDLARDWRADHQLAGLQGLYLDGRKEDGEIVAKILVDGRSNTVRKQACLVLGKIQHKGSTRGLIDVLYEEDSGLGANAYWALQRITGLKIRADPALWEQWWERTGKKTHSEHDYGLEATK